MNFPKFLFFALFLLLVSCKNQDSKPLPLDKNLEMAESFYHTKKLKEAYYYYNESLNYNIDSKNNKRIAYCLLQMADIEHIESDYINSEISVTKAISFFDENTDITYRTNALNALGRNYTQLSNFTEALKVYNNVLQLKPDELTVCITKNNIAYVYSKMGNHAKAIAILSAIENNTILDSYPLESARILHNKGYYLYYLGNINALYYLKKALKIREEHYDDAQIVSSYLQFSRSYQTINSNEAYNWAKKAYTAATKAFIADDRLEALDLLYKNTTDVNLKNKHYDDFFRINDSLNKSRQQAKNQFAKIKFDAANEIAKRKEYQIKTYIYFALFLFSTLVFFLIYRLTIKKNRAKIKETAYLTEIKIAKKLHDELANDVHNTIAFAETQDLQLATNLETLLENLDTIYIRTRNFSSENKNIDTGERYLEKLKAMLATYNSSNRNIIVNVTNFYPMDISKEVKIILYRVVQEIMVNMKKHSKCSVASITILSTIDQLKINYSDNGIGTNNLLNLKNGLQNVENRIETINGTVNFVTAYEKGFKAFILIPIK